MKIIPVRAFTDNFMYLIVSPNHTLMVDPVEPSKVEV